ncbi:MAG TPA: GNAT family N-acetyltransferase [Solirubrobacteraceae bacterium]|nr:GNAT family N-acetyltransferase [Solirubrobacteraceae bacterium]
MWAGLTRRLEGERVVLEPLSSRHAADLLEASQAPEIWRWMPYSVNGPGGFAAWLERAVADTAAGREGAFATIDRASGRAIGSSRYLTLRPEHRGLEIGHTWLAPAAWGTGANAEAKLLMLGHAFEELDCLRVEFKTDARNERSRAALAALPARFEGIFRSHMVVPYGDGVRDSAYYSVIASEWPQVRAALVARVAVSPT